MNIRFPHLKKQLENLIGYGAYRLLVAVFWITPWRGIYFFANPIYFVIYYVLKIRRDYVKESITTSFPEKSAAEIDAIVKKHYRYLSEFFVEGIKSLSLSSKELLKHCYVTNPEILTSHFDNKKSVLGLIGHFQNWELGISCAQQTPSDVAFIFKPFHNPYFNRFMLKQREKHGALLISKYKFVTTLFKRRHQPTIYFLLADHKTGGNDKWITIDFLNRPTRCLAAPGLLSKKLKLPIYYTSIERVKRGYYAVTLKPLLNPEDESVTAEMITEAGMRMLETQIQANPHCWLWIHRRWK